MNPGIPLEVEFNVRDEEKWELVNKETNSTFVLRGRGNIANLGRGDSFILQKTDDTIVSDTNGEGLLSSGECSEIEILDALLGDINSDSIINIQDVILIINLTLNNEYSNLADINLDGIVNILDIIQIVNIILSD